MSMITWMFERCAETFDFSRPKVPIKLHRPLALCLHTNEWQIAVEISNFLIQRYGWTYPRTYKFITWNLGIIEIFFLKVFLGFDRLCRRKAVFGDPKVSPTIAKAAVSGRLWRYVLVCLQILVALLSEFFSFFSKAVLSSETHKADVMHPDSRLSTLLH